MRRPRLIVILVPTLVLVYLVVLKRHYDSHDALPLRPPVPAPKVSESAPDWAVRFAVMFDAGSTGTRVHIFKLRLDLDQSHVPQLLEETFKAIKPGLSAFAEDPPQSRAGLMQLLDLARSTVPVRLHGSTPVFLKATAGLRLLQGDQADRLLEQVRALFRLSPFVSSDGSVSILDGTDEGISAWLTVNFLLGSVGGTAASVGMLDLGGGSTQVTFEPSSQFQESPSAPSDSIHVLHLFNRSYTLYTHSYLGLGLMSAREEVLGRPAPGGAVLVTPCLAPDARATWEHGPVLYNLRGRKTQDSSGPSVFLACAERVRSVLKHRVRPVEPQQFYAFSYYYERALEIGAIDEDGGVVSVVDYSSAAQRVCSGEVLNPDQSPLLCLDLVYISVLLQELGFSPDSHIKLVQRIGDVETSWALGATFHYMNL